MCGAPKFMQEPVEEAPNTEAQAAKLSFVFLPISIHSLQRLHDSTATNKLAVHPP